MLASIAISVASPPPRSPCTCPPPDIAKLSHKVHIWVSGAVRGQRPLYDHYHHHHAVTLAVVGHIQHLDDRVRRLGLAAQLAGGPCGPATHPSTTGHPGSAIGTPSPLDGGGRGNNNSNHRMGRRYESPRRTGTGAYHHHQQQPHHPGDSHSQHGSSDTGTSTRESECSEEHSPTSPAVSPLISQSKLYDSLAAELREKLSGGVPLLLPTKEYGGSTDKSSPTLATEAANRRIRNGGVCLTGGTNTPSTGHNKHGVSSRGSSGIGSDLAPSPERHDPQSSSEDEWVNDQETAMHGSSHNLVGSRPTTRDSRGGYRDEIPGPVTRMSQYRDPGPPTAYLYPNVRDEAPIQAARNRHHHQRSSSREENRSLQGSVNSHEEEVKPIITNHTPRFRNPFKSTEETYVVEERRSKKVLGGGHGQEGKKYHDERMIDQQPAVGRGRGGRGSYPPEDRIEEPAPPTAGGGRYFEDEYERERANAYRENLTDRQKYREIVTDGSGKGYRKEYDRRGPAMGYGEPQHHRGEYHREYSPERTVPVATAVPGMQSAGRRKDVAPAQHERQDFKIEREAYQQRGHGPAPTNAVRSSRESSGYKVDRTGTGAGHQRYSRSEDQHDGGGGSHAMYRDGRHAGDRGHDSPRTGYKMADKYEERWRQEAMAAGVQDRYVDPEPVTATAHRRPYHREEQSKHTPAPVAVESWKGGTEVPRKKSVEIRTSSPESTMHRISPKDRFQTAKEKFQQMERERHEQERLEQERLERERLLHSKRTVEVHASAIPARRGSLEPTAVSSHDSNGWSSPDEEEEEEEDEEEDLPHTRGGRGSNGGSSDRRGPVSYRELSPAERYPGLDREPPPPGRGGRMMPAKSLSNLVKGYRHSYAEPRPPPVSRSSGRVGLAAVNPY
ncbi:hypothetical protein AND_004968 [Anopheles darlingi]|uniref:Uncharacterized protein n=1 Tax=Anopheles darlingi TaxID=43151 RepID=W5JJ43_ANODA|nr:hypothetical protein AND_004968 [Anopheles darlingi]